jgi:hypothetical protein
MWNEIVAIKINACSVSVPEGTLSAPGRDQKYKVTLEGNQIRIADLQVNGTIIGSSIYWTTGVLFEKAKYAISFPGEDCETMGMHRIESKDDNDAAMKAVCKMAWRYTYFHRILETTFEEKSSAAYAHGCVADVYDSSVLSVAWNNNSKWQGGEPEEGSFVCAAQPLP